MFKNIKIFFYCWFSMNMDFIVVLLFHYDAHILLTTYACNGNEKTCI